MLRVPADLPQVPAGLPPGAEAKGPPELCDVAAAIRAWHRQRVGTGDAGIHLSDLSTGKYLNAFFVQGRDFIQFSVKIPFVTMEQSGNQYWLFAQGSVFNYGSAFQLLFKETS